MGALWDGSIRKSRTSLWITLSWWQEMLGVAEGCLWYLYRLASKREISVMKSAFHSYPSLPWKFPEVSLIFCLRGDTKSFIRKKAQSTYFLLNSEDRSEIIYAPLYVRCAGADVDVGPSSFTSDPWEAGKCVLPWLMAGWGVRLRLQPLRPARIEVTLPLDFLWKLTAKHGQLGAV